MAIVFAHGFNTYFHMQTVKRWPSNWLTLASIVVISLLVTLTHALVAQPGKIDPTFHFGRGSNYQFNQGYGVNDRIFTSVMLPDGSLYIGGAFTKINATTQFGIAKLDTGGKLDKSFSTGNKLSSRYLSGASIASPSVYALAVEPDGQLLVGGVFTHFGNVRVSNLVRLNSDGSQDLNFDLNLNINGHINTIALQPDGKVLIGGSFTVINGTTVNRIARLNSNGTLDGSFNIGSAADDIVQVIKLLPNGLIAIGGQFNRFNGIDRELFVVVNQQGVIQTQYNKQGHRVRPYFGLANVHDIEAGPNNTVYVAGRFVAEGMSGLQCLLKFDIQSGDLDRSYFLTLRRNELNADPLIADIEVNNVNHVYAAGIFDSVNSLPRQNLVKVRATGNVDLSYRTAAASFYHFNPSIERVHLRSNGELVFTGVFDNFEKSPIRYVAKLFPNGLEDSLWGPKDLLGFIPSGASNMITATLLQPNGKVLVAGLFGSFNHHSITRLVRLNRDGETNANFTKKLGYAEGIQMNGDINSMALDNVGNIYVVGNFSRVEGQIHQGIVKLDSTGTVIHSFNTNADLINAVVPLSNGKILIGGGFEEVNGIPRSKIALLNADGTLDRSFLSPFTINDPAVSVITLLTDGKLLVGGQQVYFNGVRTSGHCYRLMPNGLLDNTFQIGRGFNNSVNAIKLTPNGKILVAGWFDSLQGAPIYGIARLLPNGMRDPGFNATGTMIGGLSPIVHDVAIVGDSSMIIGGQFTVVHGQARRGVAKLLPNGSLDASFDPGTGLDGQVPSYINTITVYPNDQVLLGGNFDMYDGYLVNHIIRIYGQCSSITCSPITSTSKPLSAVSITTVPNPTSGIIEVLGLPEGTSKYQLVNQLGQLSQTGVIGRDNSWIDISHLSTGIYIMHVAGQRLRVIKQ